MEKNEYILSLLQKIKEQTASTQEINELINSLNEERDELPDQMEIALNALAENGRKPLTRSDIEAMADAILFIDRSNKESGFIESPLSVSPRESFIHVWWVAASLVILLATGTYIVWKNKNSNRQEIAKTKRVKKDVPPGKNGAILTLADGAQLVLDSAETGEIANQNGTKVMLQHDQLQYNIQQHTEQEQVVYNTLSTPKGRQFHLVLSDGTNVWLNAASSIHYPSRFTGNKRKVEITGEVYFDIAKNATTPFIVSAGHMEVQVMGTQFDIMAYDNEAIWKTTLLDGAIKVKNETSIKILNPGQQVQLENDRLQVINDVDEEEITAWKNGNFFFNNTDLTTIMKQIERWYDVEIVYQDEIDENYTIKISRNIPVSQLLEFMEMSGGVHFKIEGNKIIVKNNQ